MKNLKYYLYKVLKTDGIPSVFFNVGKNIIYKKHDVLKNLNDDFHGAYILIRGSVAVISLSDDGQQNIEFILAPPCEFGDIYAITGKNSQAIFKFTENSEVIYINNEELKKLIKKDDEVLNFIFKTLNKKINSFNNHYDKNFILSTDVKVAILLFEFAEEFGEKLEDCIKIDFNLTQELIGDLLGIKRSAVVRAVDKLIADNVIIRHVRDYYVKDLAVLENYVSENT